MTLRSVALAMALMTAALGPAAAADDATQAEIRSALTEWTADFNAGNAAKVCGLFEPGIRADFRGQPERDYRTICDRLKHALNQSARSYSYSSDIKEILVFGDVAVVRLVWTLTIARQDGSETKSIEPGMDVFRRQADGSWKIVRYMAYAQ